MISFIQGDARHLPLADKSVQCCVTSPPYWGLRDYGVAGQIGLEPTLSEYLTVMVDVFREVRRVLRDDGTLWLNMGDGYHNGDKGGHERSTTGKQATSRGTVKGLTANRTWQVGLKPKDLLMQPHRLAIALQEDGWYVRSDIVWAKPNPMPESVTDRPTKSHEYVFLLSKRERYYYDAEAVREGVTGNAHARGHGVNPKSASVNEGDRQRPKQNGSFSAAVAGLVSSRNLRSVWTMTTRPCKEAHFATFPIDLPLRCIKAGTSERGCCPTCGAAWKRIVDKVRSFESGSGRSGNLPVGKNGAAMQGGGETLDVRRGPTIQTTTTAWTPTCRGCPVHHPIPCTVLDIFGGAATTGLAAHELGRRAIIVERKTEYLDIGRKRLANHRPRTLKRVSQKRHKGEQLLFAEVPA